jgi:4-hydroxybenzoate polyprenyltransferase
VTAQAIPTPIARRLQDFAADIKLSHSVFAMPFALLSATLAAQRPEARWGIWSFALVVACMVCARTVAMGANRLLDAEGDRLNPRTARRAIPGGRLSKGFVGLMIALFAAGFITSAAGFGMIYGNWWPLWLSVPVLGLLWLYPLLKRFTALCHYYLGAALALAPLCAWVAFTSGVAIEPLLMAGAVLGWTAGFDIIYATADAAHDRQHGIHSVPARLGIERALGVSRLTHVGSVALLLALGWASPQLAAIWYTAVAATAGLMIVQHSLVRPEDLSRVNVAFFTVNGIISVVLGTAGIADVLVR